MIQVIQIKGAFMRCCRDTIRLWLWNHPEGPQVGDSDFCNHCGRGWIWNGAAWEPEAEKKEQSS